MTFSDTAGILNGTGEDGREVPQGFQEARGVNFALRYPLKYVPFKPTKTLIAAICVVCLIVLIVVIALAVSEDSTKGHGGTSHLSQNSTTPSPGKHQNKTVSTSKNSVRTTTAGGSGRSLPTTTTTTSTTTTSTTTTTTTTTTTESAHAPSQNKLEEVAQALFAKDNVNLVFTESRNRKSDIKMIKLNKDGSLNTENVATLAYGLNEKVLAVDFGIFLGSKCIYWATFSNSNGSAITAACEKNGFQFEVIFEDENSDIEDIAVDWLGGNIYIVDSKRNAPRIQVIKGIMGGQVPSPPVTVHVVPKMNDSNSTGLALDRPRGIALDPLHGYMFWTDWGVSPHVGRADMNGDNAIVLHAPPVSWINSITLDREHRLIYTIDALTDEIISMDYEGKNPKIFSKIPHLKHPFKMDIYRISLEETQFIWSDWTNGLVSTTNKDPTASKIQVAKANRLPLMNAVRVVDEKVLVAKQSVCLYDPEICEIDQFCVHIPAPETNFQTEVRCTTFKNDTTIEEPALKCPEDKFMCSKPEMCLPIEWQCDGEVDCEDGSDEADEICENTSRTCSSEEFKCESSYQCIPETWRCDFDPDCADGSDEKDC